MKLFGLTFLFILQTLFLFGQQVEGYVTDKNTGQELENIIVKATSVSDTTKHKNTLTDYNGFYELNDIVTGINNIPGFEEDNILFIKEGNQLRVDITSNYNIQNGAIYTVDGKKISIAEFQYFGSNKFHGTFNLTGVPNQVLIFRDNVHPGVKFLKETVPTNIVQEVDSHNNNQSNLKSALTTEEFKFNLDDDPTIDQYQPIKLTTSVDLENKSYIDFQMEKWPEFIANLYFNLQDKFGNLQTSTGLNVKSLDGQQEFNVTTNNNGDAQITNILIHHVEGDKLTPQQKDFAVRIIENDYLKQHLDTLRNITNGDFFKNYQNLIPKQQEFFANLFCTIKNEQTGNPIEGVLTELWSQGGDTARSYTNASGEIDFEDIEIAPENEITPQTITHFLKLSGDNLETITNTIQLSDGDYYKTFFMNEEDVTPTDKNYTLVINSNVPNVNWTVLTSDSTLIGSGNTGSNSLDTLYFTNTNQTLVVILKSNKEEHTNYRSETTLQAGITENRTTVNELLTYLYTLQAGAKDSESQLPLDSVGVKAFLNGQLLMSGNTLGNTSVNLQTTQPGHELDIKLLMKRNGYVDSDSIPVTIIEGTTYQIVYELVKEQTAPIEKNYTLALRSEDGDGQLLPNANWLVLDKDSVLLGSGNTGANALDTLRFLNINENLDIILKSNIEGHTDYRTETNLQAETIENRTTVNEEEQVEQQTALLRRIFRDPLEQNGTIADVVISNVEFGIQDTIHNQPQMTLWEKEVPVNANGETEYTVKYLPEVTSGNIPLYDLVKTFGLSPDETEQGYDDLESLAQEFVLKGTRKASDNGNAGEVQVVFTESDGTVHSVMTNNGAYRLGPFPVGITGDIDFIVQGAKTSNYFSHDNIPVGGSYNIRLGTVPVKDKLTNFADSVLIYNPMMIQKDWQYPVDGTTVELNKEYLKELEGTTFNASWALWGEQRCYVRPNSDAPDWINQMASFIREHTGIPYTVIIVNSEINNPPQITSLESSFLESVRNRMGNNLEILVGTSGYTDANTGGSVENLIFTTSADIRVRGQTNPPTDYQYASGLRELIGRNGKLRETNSYLSFMNGALSNSITIADMKTDFANVAIIYTNMSSRVKKQTHTGLGTLRE